MQIQQLLGLLYLWSLLSLQLQAELKYNVNFFLIMQILVFLTSIIMHDLISFQSRKGIILFQYFHSFKM